MQNKPHLSNYQATQDQIVEQQSPEIKRLPVNLRSSTDY